MQEGSKERGRKGKKLKGGDCGKKKGDCSLFVHRYNGNCLTRRGIGSCTCVLRA
jgi:hypothetical protein